MSHEIRVAETDHGDGFGPYPTVTLTTEGHDDIARLVNLLAQGLTEQIGVAADIVKKLRRNRSGRATLKLLTTIGGPDFTTHLPGEYDPARKPAVVQHEQDDQGRIVLVCPHDGCGARGTIREKVASVQLQEPLEVELADHGVVVRWDTETTSDHQHVRFVCTSCGRRVQMPEPAEVPA